MTIKEQPYTESVTGTPTVLAVGSFTLRWGAIIGGTVAALGIGTMLYSLGLALGLSAINPEDPGSVRGSGIFTGIWGLVSALVALFVGGFVAARGAAVINKATGALHGLVMWGLTVVAGLWLAGNIASSVLSSAATFGRGAGEAVVGAAGPAARNLPRELGLSSADVVAPVNARLRAQGMPEVTPQQLEAATRDALRQGVREGKLDRDALTQAIAANTALTRSDASEIAGRMEAKFEAAQGRLDRRMDEAKTSALRAAEASGKAFWGAFGALFLGMISAIAGAIVGSTWRKRKWVERAPERAPEPPHAPREEAYP